MPLRPAMRAKIASKLDWLREKITRHPMARPSRSSPAKSHPPIRLAADIGGTFTDIAVFDERTGALTFGKTLSTPERLVDGISTGVTKAGSDYASAGLFLHGSTV